MQNYCQSLERSLADLRQQNRDQNAEFNDVKIELARLKYYRDENQHLANHLQKQQSDVEEVTKVCRIIIHLFIRITANNELFIPAKLNINKGNHCQSQI